MSCCDLRHLEHYILPNEDLGYCCYDLEEVDDVDEEGRMREMAGQGSVPKLRSSPDGVQCMWEVE
jgi:hypothetical protein